MKGNPKPKTKRKTVKEMAAEIEADVDRSPDRFDEEVIRLRVAGHSSDVIAIVLGRTRIQVDQRLLLPHMKRRVKAGEALARAAVIEAVRERALGEVGRNVETLVEVRDGRDANGGEVRTTPRDRVLAVKELNALVPELAPARNSGDGDVGSFVLRVPAKLVEAMSGALMRDPGPTVALPPSIRERDADRRLAKRAEFRLLGEVAKEQEIERELFGGDPNE